MVHLDHQAENSWWPWERRRSHRQRRATLAARCVRVL